MSTARDTAIDDLELSVRSMQLLRDLGVSTVGELLDRPSIDAPKQVVAELDAIFDELGVTYTGEWRTPASAPQLAATGTVRERWTTITAWLREHGPSVLASFRPPADAAAIAAAEQALGVTLPAEYKDFLSLHDGQEDLGPMVAHCSLVPVSNLAEERAGLAELLADASFDGEGTAPGIEPVAWREGWLPIGRVQRGALVMDLAPTPAGTLGQVFSLHTDDDVRRVIATSFADLLSVFFAELQDGTIDLD
ncbi:MAG: molybdenum cofactor biosynthesis protein MoeA [Labilithrix sp.]|nr:molybdenum cofactor biosynthesis protein MoeA [Labilithrix sp.]